MLLVVVDLLRQSLHPGAKITRNASFVEVGNCCMLVAHNKKRRAKWGTAFCQLLSERLED
jgi:hypothetical protein